MGILDKFIRKDPNKAFTQEWKELNREITGDVKEGLKVFCKLVNPFDKTGKADVFNKDTEEVENRDVSDLLLSLEYIDKMKM